VLAETYARYLETRAFAEMVVEAEQLPISAREFTEIVEARLIPGTLFFELSATSESPAEAQQLAQAAANYFIQSIVEQQQEQQRLRQSISNPLTESQAALRDKLQREQTYFDEQVAQLREEIATLQASPSSPARTAQIEALQEQLSEAETNLLQTMSDQVALAQTVSPDSSDVTAVTLIESAGLPTQPVDDGHLGNILFALASGAVLGLALAFGLEYLDFTVKGPEDLEELYGAPALGVLMNMEGGAAERDLVLLDDPRSATAEAFRVLRTNIQFKAVDAPIRTLLVTSAAPAEGKTLTSINLALVFAKAGKKVILVDADLRRPTIHKRLGMSNDRGLSNLLIADHPASAGASASYLRKGPEDNLFVLTSGPVPHNPAELLSGPRTRKLVKVLGTLADVVIFDSPPAATVADAAILGAYADGTLHIIRAGKTRRDLVLKARDILHRVDAKVLGPILNGVKQGDIGYYYYYYNSSYYSENGGGNGRSPRTGRLPSFRTARQKTQQPEVSGSAQSDGG
jgi:non-specific protein-tyrosine kinase